MDILSGQIFCQKHYAVKTVVAATFIKRDPCLSGHFHTPRMIFNANAPVLSTYLSNASNSQQILSQIAQKSSLSGHFEQPDLFAFQ